MQQGFGSILVMAPGKAPRPVPLLGEVLSIGSAPDSNVILADPEVRERHAQIRFTEQGAMLFLSPGARITLNDEPPESRGPWRLQEGIVYGLGSHTLTYVAPDAESKEDTEAEQTPPAVVVPQVQPRDARPWPALRLESPPDAPPPVAATPQSRYLRYLPSIFQDPELPGVSYPTDESRSFFGRYLLIFESIWELLEQRQDYLELYFHPATSPDEFVGWLAGWFGIVVHSGLPEERRRRLATEIYELYRWRGTRYGLQRLLAICTGAWPTIVDASYPDEPGAPPPFVFRVIMELPPNSGVTRAFVADLIETHKPAHAGYILDLRP